MFSFVATTLILRFVDRVVGLRVDEAAEGEGLDRSQHGETAYVFGEGVRATRTLPRSIPMPSSRIFASNW